MRLYEFEGKKLLANEGVVSVPLGKVVESPSEVEDGMSATIAKAQVLWGKRAKAGGILSCTDSDDIRAAVAHLLDMKIRGEQVRRVLLEEKLAIAKECYLSVTYQGNELVVIASSEGGIDIEEVRNIRPENVVAQTIRVTHGLDLPTAEDILTRAGFGADAPDVAPILRNLFSFFIKHDALLVEINPLVKTKTGDWYACDAKIELDDEAAFRIAGISIGSRLGSGREPTKLESLARENDLIDSRGAAGRMFYEIEGGNIIILAAGGGTSMEALDDLYSMGGRPAIFTEYSGNPTGEKVKGLTKIALMYPGDIDAIWVIGGRANFTDVYESLINGILAGIRESSSFDKTVPIIVRRAGPRDEEAFEVMRQARDEGYNFYIRGMATSIADSARMVIYQANKHYAARRRAAV
jgi:succinyl-CoA synthetase beta subunit